MGTYADWTQCPSRGQRLGRNVHARRTIVPALDNPA
jgi:hypothetical protein